MKTFLFSLSLLTMTTVFAQEKDVEANFSSPSKWTFGWVYSPEVSYRFLSESDLADENTSWIIDSRNEDERIKFGQSFSFFFGYKLSKVFNLEAGIGYTDFGEGEKPTDFFSAMDPNIPLFTLTGTNRIHVASIPITLHVDLGGTRIQGFISAGIAPSYFLRYMRYSVLEYPNGDLVNSSSYSTSDQENYSKFILGAHISGGIDYHYTEKASLRIAPVVRITATDAYSDVPIRANYFNVGIEFGTVYKL